MRPDKVALALVIIVAATIVATMVVMLGRAVYDAAAGWWVALAVLGVLGGLGYILFRVLWERRMNAEDDHYERNVDR